MIATLSRVGAAAGAAHLVPSVAAAANVRRFLPALSGVSDTDHVALTFDDGPDPSSTPAFLDLLSDEGLRASFFLLGARLSAYPEIGKRIVAEGHEVAVHGWTHRPHLLRTPTAVSADLNRAHACVQDLLGERPRFWRPPHGIPTGAGLLTAVRLGMRPVLWTADGRDWRADASAETVTARIEPGLRRGAVVLLHDSDVTSAPRSWVAALNAIPAIARICRERDLHLGPLHEHGLRMPQGRARHAAR
jgi:peptidoglycan/xylan/chitin deacetylase (PgdA/CDA1 family)